MVGIKIRKGRKEDIEKIWKLEIESRRWHKKVVGKKYSELAKTNTNEKARKEFIRDLNNDLKKRKNFVLVALIDHQIVGWLFARFYKWTWSDNPPLISKIGDITILKKFRRQGLAKELIERVEGEAKKRGVKYIYLGFLTGNKPASNLYKKMGYEAFHLDLFKKLK